MVENVPDLDEYPVEVAIELAWDTVLDVWQMLQKTQLALEDVPHLKQLNTHNWVQPVRAEELPNEYN